MRYNYSSVFFSVITLILVHCGDVFSQKTMPTINSPVPVSPNAASLGKYGEVPVGYSTGVPNISIPIYDISSGGMKIPIGISYHAGGIRVEEVASWVGLGWSLNAGGVINRQIRGIPDEAANGYLQTNATIDKFVSYRMTDDEKRNYIDAVLNGNTDSQQDLFSYNFNGQSGKFVFKPDGTVLTIPLTKEKIEFGNFYGQDNCWKITDEEGTVYFFTAKEITYSASYFNTSNIGYPAQSLTSWYLTKMVNAVGKDTVSFEYTPTNTQFYSSMSQTQYFKQPVSSNSACPEKYPEEDYSGNTVNGFRLNKINFKNGNVSFYAKAEQRLDYYSDHALDSIVIANNDNSFHKRFNFYQSFNTGNQGSTRQLTTYDHIRMFLDSIQVRDAGSRINAYSFKYNLSSDVKLPSRVSFAQDYWGFYNGEDRNPLFTPQINANVEGIMRTIYGGDREVNDFTNQLGILTKIYYPTGGRSEFEYETNTVGRFPRTNLVNAKVGGLRIKKITNYSDSYTVASVKKYTYLNPENENLSSGSLLSFPNYVGYIHSGNNCADCETRMSCNYTTVSSGSNYPLLTTQASFVGYRYVQEYLGNDGEFGKTEYEFTSPEWYPDVVDESFPYAPALTTDWKRNRTIAEKRFRYNGLSHSYEMIDYKYFGYDDHDANGYNQVKIGKFDFMLYPNSILETIQWSSYTTPSGTYLPSSEIHRVYDQNDLAKYTETLTTYGYGSNHFKPISISTTNSKGQPVVQKLKYPFDYTDIVANDNISRGIANLIDKNISNPVIEKYTQLGSDQKVTQGLFTSYKSNIPIPDTIYATEFSQPSNDFLPSTISGGRIQKSSSYRPQVSINRNDDFGNTLEQQKLKDFPNSVFWDYQSNFPVAEIKNAAYNNTAYTSFEADATGNWDFSSSGISTVGGGSITGNKAYSLNTGNIQKTALLNSQTYVVTCWVQDGSGSVMVNGTAPDKLVTRRGWSLYQKEISSTQTATISGTGLVDELRLFPKNAQMTTYTYEALIGMTSQCDANNKITYYEYDLLGRLQVVRDQDGNIIKTLEYNYRK